MTDDIETYQNLINNNITATTQFGDKNIIEATLDDLTLVGAYHEDRLIAVMGVQQSKPYPQIDFTLTAADQQGRGWMRMLITYWLRTHGPLTSSGNQTSDAEQMWEKLLAAPGNLKLHTLDLNTGIKSKSDPWDGERTTVILVEDGGSPLQYRIQELTKSNNFKWWGGGSHPDLPNP